MFSKDKDEVMATKLKKILYAEDEEDIRAIAQIALEDLGGFTVKYCANGQDALSAAQTFIPDLILLDVMMPFKDGPTTLQELRQLKDFSSIPAVFMTAKIQAQEIEEYKKWALWMSSPSRLILWNLQTSLIKYGSNIMEKYIIDYRSFF